MSLLSGPRLSLKLVRPKALLDNCFRVMELLYCSCCKEQVGGAGGRTPGFRRRVTEQTRTLRGTPSTPQGYRAFRKAKMGPRYRDKNNGAWSGDEGGC